MTYIIYGAILVFAKISIGLFLLRFATERIYRWIYYAVMAASALTGTMLSFVVLFECHPISFFWTKHVQDESEWTGRCLSPTFVDRFVIANGAVAIASDLIYAILPISLILKLDVSRRTKFAVIPVFAMACV